MDGVGQTVAKGSGRKLRLLAAREVPHALLDRLGLEAYQPRPIDDRRREMLKDATSGLGRHQPAARTVSDFIHALCWLEPTSGESRLSSASFYELRRCAFITDRATVYLAPDHRTPLPSTFALQDNLYHESLHQELIDRLEREPVLVPTFSGQVHVPWRRTSWTAEHALQALYVYSHLRQFRRALLEYLPPSERASVEDATAAADRAREQLREQLLALEGCFEPEGRALCEAL